MTGWYRSLPKKNRIHGLCQNVEFYLNYTKFYNFLLKISVETALTGEETRVFQVRVHSFPQAKLGGGCG